MEYKKIGDLCTIVKKSVKPQKGTIYTLYSLPAFDNNNKPEVLDGEEIKSSKLLLTDNTILYNKLNVHFKRVWNVEELSSENNVCSAEFLPLKIKKHLVVQDYLYYVLTSRELTQAMYGSRRGTSGSQQRIAPETLMDYRIPVFSHEDQKKIAGILKDLDKRIWLNKMVNENLINQMKAIYDNSIDEADTLKVDDVVEFYDYMRKPLSSKERTGMARIYPYYGAANIVDYVEDFLFEGTYILVSEDGANVVDALGYPLVQYTRGKFWVNNHAHVLKGKNGVSEALAFIMLKSTNMKSIVTGAAQPKINQANLKSLDVKVPKKENLDEINDILSEMLVQVVINDAESEHLEEIKETILPKLLNEEISLDDIPE